MAKNRNGFINRSKQEEQENLKVVETKGAPSGRVQGSQQVATTMSAAEVKPEGQPTIEIKEVEVPPQVVKTTKAAEIEKAARGLGTSGSGVSGGAASLRATSYSGNSEKIMGDLSATTVLDKPDRKDTRTGKKLDSTLKHINYLYNEQVKVKYDESKPLAENPEATQGYNGTYRNEHARTQKHSGFVPADLYYDRSIDEIHQDYIYPVFGQSINDPAASSIPSYNIEAGKYEPFELSRGNHMHTALNVTFNSDGKITEFYFGDLDATPDQQSEEVANISAVNAIIDANIAELDRQEMDAKAGDELDPNWSPLPRTIKAPTDTIALLRDIEGSTGAEIFMAYRKTAACFSYQLNKAAKDGQRITGPMYEMISGCMDDEAIDHTVIKSLNEEEYQAINIFSKEFYAKGAPTLLLDVFDSTNKYSTKGDILLQPRGFRLHLQTADNNMNVFRVPAKFAQVVQANEVFSTIDRSEYDPFLPVCISDKASLAHPYSLNTFINAHAPKSFNYKYTNNSNNTYYVQVFHPLVKGLYDFFSRLGKKFYKNLPADGKLKIPCMHATTCFSLWSLIILAATPDIMKARIPAMIDVIDYEENFGYPFRQLVDMKTANPMYAKNYVNSDYNEPLVLKQMDPATAIKWVMAENLWIAKENATSNEYVLPWYHNELQYEFKDGEKIALSDIKPCVMSMPSIRSGSRLSVLDTIYGMTERELRLSLDRQTVFPCYGLVNAGEAHIYKYGLTTDGQPMITIPDSEATLAAWVKTPREIGWVIPCPNGMLTQTIKTFALTGADVNYSKTTTGRIGFEDSFAEYGCNTMRIRYWAGYGANSNTDVLETNAMNVNRAMSLRQAFKTLIATRAAGDYRQFCATDFVVSLAHCFNATAANPATVNSNSLFIPFVSATASTTKETGSGYKVVSLQKYYWTRLQRLGLAINQFDCVPSAKDLGSDDSVRSDPYDFLYIFGVAGFRGSDYNEDSYNREKVRLNLGMLFTEDPYFVDSAAYRL